MRVGKIPILFKNKQECCGCSACEAICPVGAIEMILDFEGFFYPNIDESKCSGCCICLKVCALKE